MFSFITLSLLATIVTGRPIGRTAQPRALQADSFNGTVAAAWFQGWSANYTAAQVPWSKYTHVTYSFA